MLRMPTYQHSSCDMTFPMACCSWYPSRCTCSMCCPSSSPSLTSSPRTDGSAFGPLLSVLLGPASAFCPANPLLMGLLRSIEHVSDQIWSFYCYHRLIQIFCLRKAVFWLVKYGRWPLRRTRRKLVQFFGLPSGQWSLGRRILVSRIWKICNYWSPREQRAQNQR